MFNSKLEEFELENKLQVLEKKMNLEKVNIIKNFFEKINNNETNVLVLLFQIYCIFQDSDNNERKNILKFIDMVTGNRD